MTLFRARIRLEGPIASPLASGMIFGQLCWGLRELEGEATLIAWLSHPESLWAISDAFPAGCLPRPLLAPRLAAPATDAAGYSRGKALRKHALITRSGFLRHRSALRDERLGADILRSPPDNTHRLARNSIDRHTGRALDTGGLYFRDEVWPRETGLDSPAADGAGPDRDLYIEAPDDQAMRMSRLLEHLGQSGFGKSASLGRGRFTLLDLAPDPELADMAGGGNRFVSLSRGVQTANMTDVWRRIEPHFGKAGSGATLGEGASPFKRPILLTRPGATFARAGDGRFGAWLTGVHPTRPEIGHNAFHLAIPFREADHA